MCDAPRGRDLSVYRHSCSLPGPWGVLGVSWSNQRPCTYLIISLPCCIVNHLLTGPSFPPWSDSMKAGDWVLILCEASAPALGLAQRMLSEWWMVGEGMSGLSLPLCGTSFAQGSVGVGLLQPLWPMAFSSAGAGSWPSRMGLSTLGTSAGSWPCVSWQPGPSATSVSGRGPSPQER